MATIDEILTGGNTYPTVQEVSPVMSQLGFTLTLTPQLSSGLPTTAVSITDALVAEVIKANPMQQYNFTYAFGMGSAFVPMPTVGRNMYNLSLSIFNAVPDYVGVYSFIDLLSNANNLILCSTELTSSQTTNTVKLTMRNTSIYERPAFLGIAAGATEVQQIIENISICGSIDFTNTTIGDGLSNIVGTIGTILGAVS